MTDALQTLASRLEEAKDMCLPSPQAAPQESSMAVEASREVAPPDIIARLRQWDANSQFGKPRLLEAADIIEACSETIEGQSQDIEKLAKALEPFAALKTPVRRQGNAGFYSIRFADIERAQAAYARVSDEQPLAEDAPAAECEACQRDGEARRPSLLSQGEQNHE